MFLIFSFFIVIIIGVCFSNLNHQYWKKRGVPGPKPKLFVGNFQECLLLRKSPAQVYADIYKDFPGTPIVGVYKCGTPTLIIRDPEIIKDITVKSFRKFQDNELILDKNVDPLLGRHPFFIGGEDWKATRVLLTPGFTGGKMKAIYPLVQDICRQFVQFIEKRTKAVSGESQDAKDLCIRFTLNNVTSCAFGLEAKCFEEEYGEFRFIADRFFAPGGWQNLLVHLVSIIPLLSKLITVKFISKEIEEKLANIFRQTLKYREDNNIVTNDFFHMIHRLWKTSNNPNFTDIDVIAHAAGFFGDGYETTSITMHLMLYELASNVQAQVKLREEIEKAFDTNGDLAYEHLQNLPYLEAAFNELLRLHPPLGSINRVCTESYTYIPKSRDVIKEPVVIEAGTPVILPIYGLHRDCMYFDDPNAFRPERFLSGNKDTIIKYTFMPFGEGPRACLGKRFGILQVKARVAYVIRHYEVSVNRKTKTPVDYDPLYFMTTPKHPLWLDFKKISQAKK